MRTSNRRSVRKWLSTWLAVQTFVALGLVCTAVYVATNMNLARRQDALLVQKMQVIQHLAEENAAKGNNAYLRHKLGDFFYGRPDFSLVLEIGGDRLVYGNPRQADARPDEERRLVFEIPAPSGVMKAELVQDISSDISFRVVLAWTLFACALAGAIVVSACGAWLVRRALSPVDALGRQAARLSPDRIGERLDGSDQAAEIQPLVEQFNAVLQRLEHAYVQMEGFNTDVAHELRTPLATLIGQTELALSTQPTIDELRDILASNLEELQRLSSIINDMLFLSQADRGIQARGILIAHLAEPVNEVAQYHEAEALDAGVNIMVRGDAGALVDRKLLQRAVSNLISNAIRYADGGSTVDVEISQDEHNEVLLCVSNTGETIAKEHLPRLFYRFYRTDLARAFDTGHHGLGLAIVSAIARMHRGHSFARSELRRTTIGFSIAADPDLLEIA